MPLPAAALLGAAATVVGSGINAFSQNRTNKKSRKFQEEMWNKTNAYNHPKQQMQRLQEAGLNPNMVYGQSSSGATGQASMASNPNYKAPEYGNMAQAGIEGAGSVLQAQQTSANTELQRAQTQETMQDTQNKALEAVTRTIGNAKDALSYKQQKELYKTQVQSAVKRLENLSITNEYTVNKDTREQGIYQQTLSKIKADISNARQQGNILTEEAIMKKLDREMQETYGLRPNDPYYTRIIGNIIEAITKFKM